MRSPAVQWPRQFLARDTTIEPHILKAAPVGEYPTIEMVTARGMSPPPERRIKSMNFKVATVLAGLMLATAAAPAAAGDYGYRGDGMKDGPGGIPVPAPIPIPRLKADYYIRGDIGVGLTDTLSASEEGIVYGLDAGSAPVTMPGSWMQDDGALPMTFGIGVGRYWSDHFRTDLTIDWVREQKAVAEGTMVFVDNLGGTVTASTVDKTKKEAGVFLLNAYYDFGDTRHSRLMPYIGAGLGFAVNMLDRKSNNAIDVCAACDPLSASTQSTSLALAAAAMVGFTYDLGDSILLDLNYRFLHIGGSEAALHVMGTDSVVKIDAQNEHQLRAGIRVNID